MGLLCKQNALYVKCCVIANGVTDTQGDTLYSEDIKKIFTSFNNQDNFEIYHNDLPVQEVSLLENYISQTDETIGTAVVPSGSWNAVIRVDNPEIKEALLTGEFKGVSLSNRIADKCKANLSGQVRYQDIADAECVIPIFISFVEAGANGYGLHVMDYDVYIKKSKTIVKNERSKKNMAFDLLGGLKKLVQQAEADNEPIIVKEDQTEEEEPVCTKEENTEEETSKEEPVVEKEDTEETEEEKEDDDDDATIEKEDEEETDVAPEDDEFEAKVTAIVKKVLAELEANEDETAEEVVESEEEPEDEDTPKITKSAEKVIIENNPAPQNNYYERTGRDPMTGIKVRNQSKILK